MESEPANNVVPMQVQAPAQPTHGEADERGHARSAVSLFAGAGGLDIGAEHSGFLTRAAVKGSIRPHRKRCCRTRATSRLSILGRSSPMS